MEKLYLSELIEKYNLDDRFEYDTVNLLYSSCGSGKTHFVLNHIFKSDSTQALHGGHTGHVYVTDTDILKESVNNDYLITLAKDSNCTVDELFIDGKYGKYIPNKLYVMTYFGFAHWIKKREMAFRNIYFDEVQNLINFADAFGNEYDNILDTLPELIKTVGLTLFAMSATPDSFIEFLNDCKIPYIDIVGEHKSELRCYGEKRVINYNSSLVDLIKSIKHNKILIYWVGSNESLSIERDNLADAGYNVEYLVSRQNKLSNKQNEVRDYIIKNHAFPDDIDILLINSAYQTGWNLHDTNVDTFIFTTTNQYKLMKDEYRIQSRNRIRHDIDQMFIKIPSHDIKKCDKDDFKNHNIENCRIELLESVLNEKLTAKEFKTLCSELNFRNDKHELMKSTSAIKEIEKMGYVLHKPTNSKRYYIITK